MKKIFLVAISCLFLFSDCKKDNEFLFEMKYLHDFTISAGLNPFSGTHIFERNNIPSNSIDIFAQNDRTAEDLAEINPGIAILRGLFTSPDNGYIQEISIKMYPMSDPSFEKEIFYHNQIPENSSGDMPLIGTLVNARDFLVEEEFGIRVELRLRDFSPESVDMRLDFSFFAR